MPAISSTFDSQEPFLSELLRDIESGKIQLPDFQRPWVWDDVHIRALLASVSLSYPIGAAMLMQTGGDGARFYPRLIEGVELEKPPEPERLVLDGQQRLTSLYGALFCQNSVSTRDEKQKKLDRLYYFDLQKCLDPDADRLEAIISIPADRIIRADFGRKVKLDISSQEKEYEAGLVPANILLGTEFPTWRLGYMQHFQMDVKKINWITRFEQEVWMRLQQFKVPVIQLLRNTPKEAVCQVFEHVNTGGVALTVFELMTATFAADDFQLREDWDSRKEYLHQHDILQDVGGTEFLQAVTLLSSYKRYHAGGSAVSVKRKDVLNLKLDEYKKYAKLIEAGFINAARLLNLEKIFNKPNLPYGTQFVPLAAVCAYIGKNFEKNTVRNKLKKWYWCGVLGEMYGGANESRYAQDIQDLIAWIDGQSNNEPRTIRDATFSPLRLLSLQSRQSAAYKGLMALMIQQGSHDFASGDPIAHTNGFNLPVDIHHIFPRAWAQEQDIERYYWNSIVNKAPLTSRTNRILSGHAPSIYLERIFKRNAVSEEDLEEILATHFIEPENLYEDNFDDFLLNRASELLDVIEIVMGKPVSGRDSEEVQEEFGGVL
ncbi:DUF262 domain-containing protein [Candidatus Venteria ishoeyi]|uniref:GmrSD restriction endonucleases N-terminal domain-containing protein n=1 Tax=Candidatus Venteria ishoeyi TaxID=1899563 RepID=A0A1H6F3X6_9GAMM|nr:DUF262 domain-containing protein [Candidatus Venteria ishoeyi]SEH04820.1 Uncharacterised protein [Candidatus Venteria ishoeyi]